MTLLAVLLRSLGNGLFAGRSALRRSQTSGTYVGLIVPRFPWFPPAAHAAAQWLTLLDKCVYSAVFLEESTQIFSMILSPILDVMVSPAMVRLAAACLCCVCVSQPRPLRMLCDARVQLSCVWMRSDAVRHFGWNCTGPDARHGGGERGWRHHQCAPIPTLTSIPCWMCSEACGCVVGLRMRTVPRVYACSYHVIRARAASLVLSVPLIPGCTHRTCSTRSWAA